LSSKYSRTRPMTRGRRIRARCETRDVSRRRVVMMMRAGASSRATVRGGEGCARARRRREVRAARDPRARAWWDAFGRGGGKTATTTPTTGAEDDATSGGVADAVGRERAASGVVAIKAEDSISALSALLGEDEAEARRRRELDEADARRAEAQAKERKDKEARTSRQRAFAKADAATSRIQSLQAVFLDVPLGMMDFSSMSEDAPGGEDLGDAPEWFKLPTEVFDKVTGERFVVDEESENMELVPKSSEEKEIVRLPGEFQIPVIPYPFVATPGSYVRLNLFEPRWLTLFSKLIPNGQGVDEVSPLSSSAVKTDEGEFHIERGRRVLRGLDGKSKIDLNALPIIDAYEAGARQFDIVPGFGRLPEDEFVNTNAFGALFRGLDGQIASVGTMMEVKSHDVIVDGRLLAVCAKGTKRFKVLRVAQTEPYIIVDAVPIEDEESDASPADAAEAAKSVNDVFDLMKNVDPYYMEAIGLEDVSKDDVKNMDEFDLANIMLYTHPTLALKLLACADAAKRRRVVDASAKSFKRAIELGFTPRKSRLLGSIVNLGLLFTLGFVILAIKNALAGDASGFDDFY